MGPSNPFFEKQRQIAGVVDVRMGQKGQSRSPPAATGSFWFSKMSFPCSMPQSTRPRLFPHSMSVQLPVTSWVAPKKVTFIVNSRVAALPQPFAEEKPPIFTENIIHVPARRARLIASRRRHTVFVVPAPREHGALAGAPLQFPLFRQHIRCLWGGHFTKILLYFLR